MNEGNRLVNFSIQDIIQDRKEERKIKAEQKRQVDMQRIRDMRSTTGIDPLQEFPEEIWRMIIEELDPEDRDNMCKVHPLFRDLMESSRVRDALFPQVLKLIPFRNSFKRKSRVKFIPELRRISKSARTGFDCWKEDELMNRIQGNAYNAYSDDYDVQLRSNSTTDQLIMKRLLNSYADRGDNTGRCFFPRAVAIFISERTIWNEDDIPEPFEQFRNDVTTLLRSIGDQIWYFNFSLEDLETLNLSFSTVYDLLQEWISLTPNLKWLRVFIERSSIQITGNDENISTPQFRTFPHLIDLERLSLYPAELGEFQKIYEAILGANQHINILDISEWKVKTSDAPLVPSHLTQSLDLTGFNVFDCERWNESTTLQRIQPIVNFNWPLQKIILKLINDPKRSNSLVSVFRFLENFPTLERVILESLEKFDVGHTDRIGYLKLPNLTEIKLNLTNPQIKYKSNIHFFFSLQFLVNCSKLRKINWGLSQFHYGKLWTIMFNYENCNAGTVVDFRAGLRYLYDSNIWDVFPSLQSIKVVICKEVRSRSCTQEFRRCDIESMTTTQFIKAHVCFRRRKETIRGGFWACVMCNSV